MKIILLPVTRFWLPEVFLCHQEIASALLHRCQNAQIALYPAVVVVGDVSFEPDSENNTLGVAIELKLSPNEEDMFGINGFSDHEVTITLKYTVVFDWNIAISRCVTDAELSEDQKSFV